MKFQLASIQSLQVHAALEIHFKHVVYHQDIVYLHTCDVTFSPPRISRYKTQHIYQAISHINLAVV